MPTIYNGGQSRLEYFALNGNVQVNGGLGRPELINKTTIKYGKSFKNHEITGNAGDEYGTTHTNANSDALTPYRGKGTNEGYDSNNTYNGFVTRFNYNGGDKFDVTGGDASLEAGTSLVGTAIGRKQSIILNLTTFGYGPDQTNAGSTKDWYREPNTSGNIGQVII